MGRLLNPGIVRQSRRCYILQVGIPVRAGQAQAPAGHVGHVESDMISMSVSNRQQSDQTASD